MTNYEKMFTDWNKLRYEGAYLGFKKKDFSKMYFYISQRIGVEQAEYFNNQTKLYKRVYCAYVCYMFHPNKATQDEAFKYYKKREEVLN